MVGCIGITLAAFASLGLGAIIQERPGRPFKAAYTKRNALLPAVNRAAGYVSDVFIAPRDNVTLFYGGAADSNKPTAAMVTLSRMSYNTVSLEQIESITNVKCSGNKINISFKNEAAYKEAQQQWTSKIVDGLVLVTHTAGCGVGYPEQHSFLQMSSFSDSSSDAENVLTGSYNEIRPSTIARNVDIKFGQYDTPGASLAPQPGPQSITMVQGVDPSATFQFDFVPNADADTPFGKAMTLYKHSSSTPIGRADAGIYCVDCGAKGSLKLSGHINVGLDDFFPKINKLAVDMDVNMKARMAVAVTAGIPPLNVDLDAHLLEMDMGPFSIADFVSIKPTMAVDLGGKVNVRASTASLVGVELNWPKLNANINLAEYTADTDGTSPDLQVVSDIRPGAAEADISIDPKIQVTIAADILMGYLQAKVFIKDNPIIEMHAKASDTCLTAGIRNQINVSGTAAGQTMEVPDLEWQGPMISACDSDAAGVAPNLSPAALPEPSGYTSASSAPSPSMPSTAPELSSSSSSSLSSTPATSSSSSSTNVPIAPATSQSPAPPEPSAGPPTPPTPFAPKPSSEPPIEPAPQPQSPQSQPQPQQPKEAQPQPLQQQPLPLILPSSTKQPQEPETNPVPQSPSPPIVPQEPQPAQLPQPMVPQTIQQQEPPSPPPGTGAGNDEDGEDEQDTPAEAGAAAAAEPSAYLVATVPARRLSDKT